MNSYIGYLYDPSTEMYLYYGAQSTSVYVGPGNSSCISVFHRPMFYCTHIRLKLF